MHVLFLAPDTHVYNHAFLRGLVSVGAKVSGLGPGPADKVSAGAKAHLASYRACAKELAAGAPFDRIETIDEPLIEPAARLREALGVPGLSVATARLCRDKVAMKEFLRARGIPCAASAGVESAAELRDCG